MATWWVNQGQTFEAEVRGGYMWSPKLNRKGQQLKAYEYMKQVRPGDLVFSYSDQQIRAVGLVLKSAVTWTKPAELDVDWNPDGWKVEVDYSVTETPFSPRSAWEQVRALLPEKYAPLTKNGTGSQSAYLSLVSDELGAFLMSQIEAGLLVMPREITADDEEEYLEEKAIWQDLSLEDTQRESIVNSRRGQGTFKKRVYSFEKSCRITGVTEPRLLIASHIKPWRVSDPNERLDGNNGLMLSPHIDRLFDRGLLTFGERGDIFVSRQLSSHVLESWHIDKTKNVGKFTKDQARFLEYHRDSVFERTVW